MQHPTNNPDWPGQICHEPIALNVRLVAGVDEPEGDRGNSLSRLELEQKAIRLAGFRAGASAAEMQAVIGVSWRLLVLQVMPIFLHPSGL